MIFKASSKSFMLVMMVMIISALTSCSTLISDSTVTPTNTATNIPTKTEIPTATVTLTSTSTPSLIVMVTPRDWKSEEIEFLLVIQDSLRTDNREKLASLIHYPIKISLLDESELEIKNASEFLANYEKIVTPEWKDLVLTQEPAELFSNWQGAMVHRGELWFTSVCTDATCKHSQYYIVAIRQIDWSN